MKTEQQEVIDTADILDSLLSSNGKFSKFCKKIDVLVEEFVANVYNLGLRSRVDRFGSISGWIGDVKLSVYPQRGKVYIRFEKGAYYISFVASEDGDPEMVFAALCSPPDLAVEIVRRVIDVFKKEESSIYPLLEKLKYSRS